MLNGKLHSGKKFQCICFKESDESNPWITFEIKSAESETPPDSTVPVQLCGVINIAYLIL